MLCPGLDDINYCFLKSTKWYPLEIFLEYWLNTIRIGKIVAVPDHRIESPFEDRCGINPWRHMRFHDHMLNETLDAFEKLVQAIEARLPQADSLTDDSIEHGLVDADVIQLHDIAPGLVREFLTCARVPRFKYIAPGLSVMNTSTFDKQPFVPNPERDCMKGDVPAMLLFHSDLNYDNSKVLKDRYAYSPFPYRDISTFPAGVYLNPTGHSRCDDAFTFFLPFKVGESEYLYTTDGMGSM